jgi:hypothetical protein
MKVSLTKPHILDEATEKAIVSGLALEVRCQEMNENGQIREDLQSCPRRVFGTGVPDQNLGQVTNYPDC